MQVHDELCLEDLPELCGHPGKGGREPSLEGDRPLARSFVQDVPPLETIQSALYGATRFAESLLGAAGVVGVRLSRMICTPDGRCWTLAFGEHFFTVEVMGDGFSVRPLRPSVAVLAA